MKRLILICALMSLPLLLAGCFRSAGDTIAPTAEATLIAVVDATAVPVDATPVDAPAGDATPIPPDNSGQPTVPPITILPPNTRPPTTAAGTSEVETASTAGSTREPGSIAPPPTETPQFITPGSPMGAVPFDTSVPQPTGGTRTGGSAALTGGTPAPEATETEGDQCIYVVESGDTLYAIALANDTTIDDILAINPELEDEDATLFPDDEIILPDCGENTGVETDEPEPTARPTSAGTPAPGEVYTVRAGDTLFNIAQRYGITIAEIVAVNPDINPDVLAIGQEITLPAEDE